MAASANGGDDAGKAEAVSSSPEIRLLIEELLMQSDQPGFAARLDSPGAVLHVRRRHPSGRPGRAPQHLHDWLDWGCEAYTRALSIAGLLGRRIWEWVDELESAGGRTGHGREEVEPPPLIVLPPGEPGTKVSNWLTIHNPEPVSIYLRLECPSLISADHRIEGEDVKFEPATIDLKPRSRERLLVTLDIPADAKPGSYLGIVESVGILGYQAMVSASVV
jgi:hypothetical protein